MTKPPPTIGDTYSLDGIEVVELWEVDLDFAVEEAFRQGSAIAPDATRSEAANAQELAGLELFRDVGAEDIAAIAAQSQSIHAIPGYVLLPPGRLNTKIFFVLEGQLRIYARTGDKRPLAVADVGQSTGLRAALTAQPANHAVIATETSHVLAVDAAAIDALAKRSHALARNYTALLASYLRGDDCLHVGTRSRAAAPRQGYIDELTLLHNQYWLDTVFPRLVGRYRMGDKTLAVAAFAVDQLDAIIREYGVGAGMRVLETIGPWALDQTRPTDILAIDKSRHFLLFLPDCGLDAARRLADRLKQQVQTLPITLATPKAPAPVHVTLALGIAELATGMNDREFLKQTEALVLKSMKLGGNWLSESLETPSAPEA